MAGTPAPVICPSGESVMVAWLLPLMRFGIGYNLPPGQTTTRSERVTWGVITLGMTSNWILQPVQRGIVWATPWILRTAWAGTKIVAADLGLMGRAALGTRTVTAVAAVGAGYTIGAVTGTIIIHVAEEEGIVYEGATADVLDFYTGEGQYWAQNEDDPTPGFFNIPGNTKFIAQHYWEEWRSN